MRGRAGKCVFIRGAHMVPSPGPMMRRQPLRRRLTCCGAAVLVLLAAGAAAAADAAPIELRRRTITAAAPQARSAPAAPRRLQLVQFEKAPTDADLEDLRAAGVHLVAPVPRDAWLVWTDDDAQVAALAPARRRSLRQRTGFEPRDALAPALDERIGDATPVDVTVQFVAGTEQTAADVQRVAALAAATLAPARKAVFDRYVNLGVRVRGADLEAIAGLETVVNVEPLLAPRPWDERQGQILAGAVVGDGSAPAGPGYLDFLAAAGFPTDPVAYPIVAVVDDGVDNGSTAPVAADLYRFGLKTNPSRLVFAVRPPGSTAPDASGPDGHGSINASIVGGYNAAAGAGVEDAAGFNYGLGIAPFTRLGNVRIFHPNYDVGSGTTAMVADYFARGARISANSWGADVFGSYDTSAQEYDALTRDAQPGIPGNQQLLFVFAAGNEGPTAGSVGSPGTAKNVISVGASETANPAAVTGSGCGDDGSDGDDARDMSGFSSRGPCNDGRIKPDIVAPGTFIQGLAAQPVFNGSGVCGPAGNDFAAPGSDALFPPGSVYTWSSGTSHATPAVAGAAALAHEYLGRVHGRANPSPALTKAFLLHGTRHLTGDLANESLPGRNQGFGLLRLDTIFDAATPRLLHDQATVFGTPGQTFEMVGEVADAGSPLRVVLAWTDAPGSTFAPAPVNDLDLVVEVDGVVYRGNNFTGGTSRTGGVRDPRNNVEAVFLPPGTTGLVRVTVAAATIAGDGVPGNGDITDQDFALVLGNVTDFTPRGTISLAAGVYNCAAQATIRLADSDLAGSGTAAVVATATSGDVEVVTLTEAPVGSGLFVGTVTTAAGTAIADGVLQVGDGDTISVVYEDADDGSGAAAAAADHAAVDCTAPGLADVAAVARNGGAVTVSLASDEPTTVVVRYGTGCDALSQSRSSDTLAGAHEIDIGGLTPETTYAWRLEVSDAAGNLTLADDGGTCFLVATPPPTRYFAELFDGDFDLANTTLTLVPDGSPHFYSACRSAASAFPTDPAGGVLLDLADDDNAEVVLADGREVSLYGLASDTLFVGSNGYVTFAADSDYSESLADHFSLPRVSALFDDLNPAAGGSVSYRQLGDRIAVTYQAVPEYPSAGANHMQIELFFDGRLSITWLAMSARDGLAGVAAGAGLPDDFSEADLGAADTCSQSGGTIGFDAAFYRCGDAIGLELRDSDLVGTPSVAVEVGTGSGDSEAVLLLETPPNSGRFAATAPGDAGAVVAGDGIVQFAGGDALTAAYRDASDGDGQPRTVTAGATAFCADPFVLYRTNRSRSAARFRSFAPVELGDAFGTAAYKVMKVEHLGMPATVDGVAPGNAATHLRAYRLRAERDQAPFLPHADVRVRNRCGTLFLEVQRPTGVLVPAALSTAAPVTAPAEGSHRLDAYVCYDVRVQSRLSGGDAVAGLASGIQIEAADALNGGAARRYDLAAVTRLCRPAAIDGAPLLTAGPDRGTPWAITPATVRNPNQSLLCYAAKPARRFIAQNGCGPALPGDRGVALDPRQPRHQRVGDLHSADGFAATVAVSIKEQEVCLPAVVE